jgi:hypothetical protein
MEIISEYDIGRKEQACCHFSTLTCSSLSLGDVDHHDTNQSSDKEKASLYQWFVGETQRERPAPACEQVCKRSTKNRPHQQARIE